MTTDRGTSRQTRAKNTRERILLAAAETFAAHGFRATTVRTICAKARANVAAVSYYFGSKENLYFQTFAFVYEHSTSPALAQCPGPVTSPEQWRQELHAWAAGMLASIAGRDKWHAWHCRLFARERNDPSQVMPLIFERFLLPIKQRLEYLLRLALPPDVAPEELTIWTVSTVAQLTVYAYRTPPWDTVLIPEGMTHEQWVDRVAWHIVDSITSRLSFRGPPA